MPTNLNPLNMGNNLRLRRIAVAPHNQEEKCAVRSLLWGVSGECEILGAPPPLIGKGLSSQALHKQMREREAYFERLLAAMIGFSNTFGGRVFLGVQHAGDGERFPGRAMLSDTLESLHIPELLRSSLLEADQKAALEARVGGIDLTALGGDGPFAPEPGQEEIAEASGRSFLSETVSIWST